ncbi:hypothetical protein EIM48_14450 [Pseudoxanthomonas sp. SGNA-20]|uniref:hypothetical protein n=1 Tax=Pseudoxanthomonas sp. SGNA-20 TaxID=2493088 RepID=UPI000F63B877|nr:hypothetical protein [Pseudoxanthomonas sp. SGNA-20]RRN53990.1 hypothetical protein EIM48_14450 [Pseudoxanthomonas sp. SGNA-20]
MNFFVGAAAAVSYLLFFMAYQYVRPKKVLSVMDMFFFMFSLQFGPHSIFLHPYLEDRGFASSVYPQYATGLTLAFCGLATGLFAAGALAKTRSVQLYPFRGADLTLKRSFVILGVAAAYLVLFVAYQGFDLSRTLNYLNFFRGNSLYTYTELRRELYEGDAGLSLAAVTRQTSSAIIFSALVYSGIKFRTWRLVFFGMAALLFIICCLQMNKFPFLYYTLLASLVVFAHRAYRTGVFINKSIAFKVAITGGSLVGLLTALYWIQYRNEIEAGIVTSDRILFRIISRPFAGNHGSLYYWFDVFPQKHDFVGLANVPAVARIFGMEPFAPTIAVPSYYLDANTTFQAGYIGGAYASFGYAGIWVYSLFVGGWVSLLTAYEGKIDVLWQRIAFFSVVGLNMYFLSSRELHTAMQSGGFVLAPLMIFAVRNLPRTLRTGTLK